MESFKSVSVINFDTSIKKINEHFKISTTKGFGISKDNQGSWYKVKLKNGEFVDCKLFGKFRTKNLKSTNP